MVAALYARNQGLFLRKCGRPAFSFGGFPKSTRDILSKQYVTFGGMIFALRDRQILTAVRAAICSEMSLEKF
ncbi:hypothetical protein DQG13_16255 [Paenibacillus sp. YN15]|nr:hypothetical protein DQG13_16255 [Paenibacillus sp. YN15]